MKQIFGLVLTFGIACAWHMPAAAQGEANTYASCLAENFDTSESGSELVTAQYARALETCTRERNAIYDAVTVPNDGDLGTIVHALHLTNWRYRYLSSQALSGAVRYLFDMPLFSPGPHSTIAQIYAECLVRNTDAIRGLDYKIIGPLCPDPSIWEREFQSRLSSEHPDMDSAWIALIAYADAEVLKHAVGAQVASQLLERASGTANN